MIQKISTRSNIKDIFSHSFREFFLALKAVWVYIISVAFIHYLYIFLIAHFLAGSKNLILYISIYKILLYPALVIFIVHFIRCGIEKKPPLDINTIFAHTKRCYGRVFIFYFLVNMAESNLGYLSMLMIFVVMYLKFPFIEAVIFFKDTSLSDSLKDNYRITKENLFKYLSLILFVFFICIFLWGFFLTSVTGGEVKSLFKVVLGLFSVTMMFLFKSYLAVLYYKIAKK